MDSLFLEYNTLVIVGGSSRSSIETVADVRSDRFFTVRTARTGSLGVTTTLIHVGACLRGVYSVGIQQ